MTTAPIYRLTMYAPRTTSNPSETTIMTPAAGAIHSDSFKVASATGVSGFQPYLGIPNGGGSITKLPDVRSTIGEYEVTLYDFRPSETNTTLERWVTAFMGDSNRQIRFVGRKVLLEESLDAGSTWHTFFAGRVFSMELTGPQTYRIKIRDTVQSLHQEIFGVRPDPNQVTYAATETLLPIGFSQAIGSVAAPTKLRGTITYKGPIGNTWLFGSTSYRITLDSGSQVRADNLVTPLWNEAARTITFSPALWGSRSNLRAVCYNSTHPSSNVVPLTAVVDFSSKKVGSTERFDSIAVEQFSTGLLSFGATSFDPTAAGWAVGDTVDFFCYYDAPVSERNRLWLGDVHPVQLWKDILDGKFNISSSLMTVPYDSVAFASLISDTTIPTARFAVAKPTDMAGFIENAICKPYGLAYGIKINPSASTAQIVPFKTTLPAALPSNSISTADVIAGSQVQWEAGEPLAYIKYISYEDTVVPLSVDTTAQGKLQQTGDSDGNFQLIKSNPFATSIINENDSDITENNLTIDATGNRYFYALQGSVSESAYRAQSTAAQFAHYYLNRFLYGAPTVRLSLRKSDTIMSMSVGDWTTVDIDKLPDANSHLRGGVRLMQVVEKSPTINSINLTLLDGALTSSMAIPTISSVAAYASSSTDSIQVNLSTSDDAIVEVQYAIVATSGAQPSSTSALWQFAGRIAINATTGILWFPVPRGKRIWVRARSFSPPSQNLKLPSGFTSPGTAFVDVAALTAPSSLSVTGITLAAATASWTVGDPSASVQVFLGSPSGSALSSLTYLQAGSSQYILKGLNTYVSSSFTVGVRHVDNLNISTTTTRNFSVSGSAATLPSMSYCFAYVG